VLYFYQHTCSIINWNKPIAYKINKFVKEEIMTNQIFSGSSRGLKMPSFNLDHQRKLFIGFILLLALLAFEIFNFDTTQFALQSLLGDVRFLGIMWATILAIAFCSIDFAGLIRLFSPESGSGVNKEAWYLMGAWLLGATMNAVMTWWAVSVTLLNHEFGNEVLSREQLLRYVPIFVAVLVWLTRILFIGAFSIAGAQLFESTKSPSRPSAAKIPQSTPNGVSNPGRKATKPRRFKAAPKQKTSNSREMTYSTSTVQTREEQPTSPPPPVPSQESGSNYNNAQRSSRVRHRPPVPNGGLRKPGSRLQARHRN
jgi:hypothetical protein